MPTYVHGRNAFLCASLTSSTSTLLHGDANTMTLAFTKDNPQVTTFNDLYHQRVSGLIDATFTGAFVYNTDIDASSLALTLKDILDASTPVPLNYAPAGSVAGCPLYSACMLLSAFDITGPLNGPVAGTFSFQQASGSIVTGCCAA